MTSDEADDLSALAVELEQLAFGHEKLIQRLDLGRARSLRSLARRIRAVASGALSTEEAHREALGLRLEAMVAILTEQETAPPITARRAAGAEVIPLCRVRKRS